MNIIPPLNQIHPSPLREMGDSLGQANDYVVAIFQFGASSMTLNFKS
jgi:hypothetical protein